MFDTRRERIVAGVGAPVIALLLYLLLAGGDEEAPAPARVMAVAPTRAPIASPPPPAPLAAPQTAALHEPTAALSGATLAGVMSGGPGGGSAIIAYAGGSQRLVSVGRDVLPGVTLREVRHDRVMLSGPSGPIELTFGRSIGAAQTAAAPTAGLPAADDPVRTTDSSARTLVRALQPQRVAGRVVGYRVRSPAEIPLLQRAGLQPGDVLVSVNGNAIDGQERLTGIPAEIAGASAVEVEFDRGGRRMRSRVTTAQQ